VLVLDEPESPLDFRNQFYDYQPYQEAGQGTWPVLHRQYALPGMGYKYLYFLYGPFLILYDFYMDNRFIIRLIFSIKDWVC